MKLVKEDFLNENKTEILVNTDKWDFIVNNYEKEQIKNLISDAIQDYSIPMPLRTISYEDSKNDFIQLMNLDTSKMLKKSKTYTRYDYKYPMSDFFIEQSKIGNLSSDYFQQYNRFLCDSINSPSPYRTWHQEKFRKTLLNSLFTLKFKDLNTTNLRNAIGLRKYIASQFKPSVAKFLYDKFQAKKVLDFSSGWGDRLAAFYASKNTSFYFGIDPNERLFDKYNDQISMYNDELKKNGVHKEVKLVNSPAENIDFKDYGNPKFDFIFTSPPYFNIERYTQDEHQSWKKYKKIDSWLENFLFNVLEKAWNQLEDGGVLAINISDVYSNHTINKICDPMNDFISKLDGAKYLGCIGMRMSKRPNSKADKSNGIFIEPIWIFSKKSNKKINYYFDNNQIL